VALLGKTAGQGHVYAMLALEGIYRMWKEYAQAVRWATQGAEAGLPTSMYNLARSLDMGEGVPAPDYPAAVDWYERAADAGVANAAANLSGMYTVGRGWA